MCWAGLGGARGVLYAYIKADGHSVELSLNLSLLLPPSWVLHPSLDTHPDPYLIYFPPLSHPTVCSLHWSSSSCVFLVPSFLPSTLLSARVSFFYLDFLLKKSLWRGLIHLIYELKNNLLDLVLGVDKWVDGLSQKTKIKIWLNIMAYHQCKHYSNNL